MRTWPGLAAIGAGLIHLGLSAGSPPLQLVVLLIPGIAEVGWGVLALARPERMRPAAALASAATLVGLQILVLLSGVHAHGSPGTSPGGAIAGATVLDLAVAALVAVRIRRGSGAEPGPAGFLLGTALGSAVVGVVTASSLASTSLPHTH